MTLDVFLMVVAAQAGDEGKKEGEQSGKQCGNTTANRVPQEASS